MSEITREWLSANYIELSGAILGLAYIFFSIRQNILTWPTGLATSLLYAAVFFQSKIYASMALQFYYVAVSIYGWYFWLKGRKTDEKAGVPVTRLNLRLAGWLLLVGVLVYGVILFVLMRFTDSPVPFLDSLITAMSVVATWMLARKILEHWLIWVVADLISAGLYVYRDLWLTAVLFLIYTGMAVSGYFEWKKEWRKPAC